MSGGVEIRTKMKFIISIRDSDNLLQVSRLEPALKDQGFRREVWPDRFSESLTGTASSHGPAEVVDLVAGLVVVHNNSMILSQRSRLSLFSWDDQEIDFISHKSVSRITMSVSLKSNYQKEREREISDSKSPRYHNFSLISQASWSLISLHLLGFLISELSEISEIS